MKKFSRSFIFKDGLPCSARNNLMILFGFFRALLASHFQILACDIACNL